MNALYLKSKEMPHKLITEVLDIAPQTLGTYFDLFEAGRVEGLKQLRYKGQSSELNKHTVAIITALEENPPATLKEVLYNKFHQDYERFCKAITNCLEQIHSTHVEAIETLLTPKLQSWQNSDINP